MSRLNYMQDHELAVQTILDEVRVLERYVALGGQLDEQVVRDLLHSLERLSDIVKAAEQAEATRWETDHEPLPPWLQPKADDEDEKRDQTAKKA